MQQLIIYATYSGSTMMAAQHLQQLLQAAGNEVDLKMALEVTPEEITQAELVILACPSWDYNGEEGMPHDDFMTLQEKLGDAKFEGKEFAILGLGDKNYNKFCGANNHLKDWVEKLGGKLVGQPLEIDQYFMNEETAKQQIEKWAAELKK